MMNKCELVHLSPITDMAAAVKIFRLPPGASGDVLPGGKIAGGYNSFVDSYAVHFLPPHLTKHLTTAGRSFANSAWIVQKAYHMLEDRLFESWPVGK